MFESFQTEVTVEALHLDDCVDTYGMSIGFDGSSNYNDVSADVFANPFTAFNTIHNSTFYLWNLDCCVVDGCLSCSVYIEESIAFRKFTVVANVWFF